MPVIGSEEVRVMKPPKGVEAGELPDHDVQIAASNEDEVFAPIPFLLRTQLRIQIHESVQSVQLKLGIRSKPERLKEYMENMRKVKSWTNCSYCWRPDRHSFIVSFTMCSLPVVFVSFLFCYRLSQVDFRSYCFDIAMSSFQPVEVWLHVQVWYFSKECTNLQLHVYLCRRVGRHIRRRSRIHMWKRRKEK
jgi:hypothetical protein